MILLIEPISKKIGMFVPAYPLPIMELASFVKFNMPEAEIGIISIPIDYGLPLTKEGKQQIYKELLDEISKIGPTGIGISCTAIAQAEEVIHLSEQIKDSNPNIFIFLGGYFPTIYYKEIFSRTSAVDAIVVGEGETTALEIVRYLEIMKDPRDKSVPNLAWKSNGQIHTTHMGVRFDPSKKALLNLELLSHPKAYDILPYAFSRGCPYHCNFCMEASIRPTRKAVPSTIVKNDLENLSRQTNTRNLFVSDALFKSFNLFPFLRSLGMKLTFETRCDVLNPAMIPDIADVCGMLLLGFESASYDTLRRMNKIKDKAHYKKYLANTSAIFKEAVNNEIPVMIFMIAGYPGDTEKDLEKSLNFTRELSKEAGTGGHVFKIGECHVYPNTKIYELARSLPDVVFDDDGVFGQNVVRKPSKDLDFETILKYNKEIFNFSNTTPKLLENFMKVMPFFRLPADALRDEIIPEQCFKGSDRDIFNVKAESLSVFRSVVPRLSEKYRDGMSEERSRRNLPI